MISILRKIKKGKLSFEGDRPAIITWRETLTYSGLENKIQSAAEYFYSLGVREKKKVAVISSNNIEFVICLLALWELNSCVIPLNIRLTDDELSELLEFSNADFVLIHKSEKRNLSVKIPKIIFPFNSSESILKKKLPGINPDDISLIMFTSGATGKPKGVMHSLNDLLNSADNSQSLFPQTRDDKWLASLPFFHIGGLSIITRTLRFGSALIIPGSLKNSDLKKAFNNHNPTLASFVTTQLKRLLDTGWKPGNELKNLLLGGGFSDEKLIKRALSAGCRIVNVYGSTETSAFVTANSGENIIRIPLSVGKPLGRNKIFIVDDDFNIKDDNSSGQILIEGNSLFHGYYKDLAATRYKLKHGKFLTGDIGFLDERGNLFVEARRTDLIVTGGENVNPAEVENILNKLPKINESCVFALEDTEWGQIVAAAVVVNGQFNAEEIIRFMKGKIAAYKIPKRIFPLAKFPKSSLDKILREKVREEIKKLIK